MFDTELQVSSATVETFETEVSTRVHAIEVATKLVQYMPKCTAQTSSKDATQAANGDHGDQVPEQEGVSEAIENALSSLTNQLNALGEETALLQQAMQRVIKRQFQGTERLYTKLDMLQTTCKTPIVNNDKRYNATKQQKSLLDC